MTTGKSFSLTDEERRGLEHIFRRRKSFRRKADGLIFRRANALLLLDKGWKAQAVADGYCQVDGRVSGMYQTE